MRLGWQVQTMEEHNHRDRDDRDAPPVKVRGGRPASSSSVHAPAKPTLAPIITSAGECMWRASREIPITPAAMAATRSAA